MNQFKFHFQTKKLEDGSIVREPKIEVEFIGPKNRIVQYAILDSGSSVSYIPLEIANALGLEFEHGREEAITGIGGEEKAANSKVSFKISRNRQQKIIEADVLVFLNNDMRYLILGIKPFFEIFDVEFKFQENKIILRESSKIKRL